ncbi:D-sedoheptulose-7-phosphate isomerase [Wohlfahrtiimonas chitiniclastica]|uniref:Phosphoheptose isomerase n=1 Tax=Wohlfahrtiimonas chitiniclastica SH04 TaxID=1261130 RepID=L8XY03_9GAMM|nr:D-sedoheptulose 7-phosphate isomerase [Wohlfahrtiimonas chitiniclastica]ELV07630.1 Phosphoheptose isomerase [Wohlfahrtiimonas chitiniclastica SH04]KZX36377.1 phosphoheptose isomerase [Wohlfahrtiimonas chitiniclastica]MBS7817015.1 D-sedoheptulose 7-phosphate isomerase [Wohlfahrtiimonas chitiniclastica]MBS7818569.1 D-sedoheptulose 7-phosphate isomerase [Wohlfahrtiimonas chitiniclastica]MBS7820795.1 D-sedoheptulose 7-phosphate isomerase [Wohlfahrtiimonas chitiniclastica]
MKDNIIAQIEASIATKAAILEDANLIATLENVAETLIDVYREQGKILIVGNGGSAADAQHMAAELVGRFELEREGLPAIALTTDTSILTAVGNDYGYHYTFARQVEALGQPNDALIAISTSGNSESIVNAVKAARKKGIYTIGLTGSRACMMDELCDVMIKIPSTHTPRIQESHLLVEHMLCQLIETALFAPS